MRIASSTGKWLYVLAWIVVGLVPNILLGLFRGRNEPRPPTRAWWRATATPRPSFTLGAVFLTAAVVCGLGGVAGRLAAMSPFSNVFLIGGYLSRRGVLPPFGLEAGASSRRVVYDRQQA